MKPGGGKEKGSSFEREIAAELSSWITQGTRTDLFRRTVLSGGQFTQGKSLRGEPGDLGPNHELAFPFCNKFVVECKCWQWLDLTNTIWGKGDLHDALLKVQEEALKCSKHWMLITKENRRQTIVFMPTVVAVELIANQELHYHILFNGSVYLTRFSELMRLVHPSKLVGEYKIKRSTLNL